MLCKKLDAFFFAFSLSFYFFGLTESEEIVNIIEK